jgi:MerR family redox-sensitive transcriptional activator SoxR
VISGLSIGELAHETTTPISTIRFYERKGLLASPPRESGQRRYPLGAVDRVRLIHMWQHAGFSLGEIAQLLTDRENIQAWKELVRTKISELTLLQAEITRSREQLEHALLCRAPDWTACPTMQATARAETVPRSSR